MIILRERNTELLVTRHGSNKEEDKYLLTSTIDIKGERRNPEYGGSTIR